MSIASRAHGTLKRRPAVVPRKLSRLHKPEMMSLEAWQIALRRQLGREETFALTNVGDRPIFSEFHVTNPKSGNTYRVVIRGGSPGSNFCSCPDFATNTLGTCKHVEFTLARLERRRDARAALTHGWSPPYSEIYVRYGARREVRFRPRADAPATLRRLAGRYFDPDGVLRPEAARHFEDFIAETELIDPGRRCYDDALALVAQMRDAERRAARLAAAFPRGTRSPAFKRLLRIELYDYQRQATLFAARAGRCLIADDMGLGKTIEAIAAVEIMGRYFGVERVLVVCPTSLKHQWEREIARAIGRATVVVGGLRARREAGFRAESFYKVTNYDTVHQDLDLIGAWSPDVVILDEAQRIKNWTTRTATSVKKIASPYAIVLTGTPLENRLEELVSIVDFVDRHRLGPTFRFLHDHQVRDEFGRVVGYRDLNRIGRTLAPILLRRRKSEVLDQLPPRLEKRFHVSMTPEQMRHHDENREVVARLVAKWRRHRFLSETDQRRLMIALQNMRMACDSSYLLDGTSDHGTKADELMTVLEELFERPEIKAVVFSQWVRMHELLARRLQERGWSHVFFHGGVESAKRKEMVDRFRDDPGCRVFLSTDAGGVGLNLQHASVVVNVDLPWNPAVLEQRIGRVHRLGQTRPVQVVSFVAKGTIEEGMLGLLGFKRSLFGGVLDGGEREVFLGGDRFKRFMESVEKVTAAIPEPLIEEASQVPASDGPGQSDDARGAASNGRTGATDGDPLASLLRTGLQLVQQFLTAAQAHDGGRVPGGNGASVRPFETVRDEQTGEKYLKIKMPAPDVVDRVAQSLQALLESLQR
jgi:superfamily II DNA or RNA helicase